MSYKFTMLPLKQLVYQCNLSLSPHVHLHTKQDDGFIHSFSFIPNNMKEKTPLFSLFPSTLVIYVPLFLFFSLSYQTHSQRTFLSASGMAPLVMSKGCCVGCPCRGLFSRKRVESTHGRYNVWKVFQKNEVVLLFTYC